MPACRFRSSKRRLELQQRCALPGLPINARTCVFGVLRGHLHLPRDVVLHHFAQVVIAVVLVAQQHIVADAGGHEDLLYARDLAHFAQQVDLRLVVHLHQRADFRVDAAFGGADALGEFPAALEAVHVGGRAAQVLDVALEIGMPRQPPGLGQDRCGAAPAHGGAFVDGDGAEVAFAVTAAMGGNGKSDGFQGLDLALPLVERVLAPLEIEGVDGIQFGLRFGQGGRVLDQVAVGVFLVQSMRADGVVVAVKACGTFR